MSLMGKRSLTVAGKTALRLGDESAQGMIEFAFMIMFLMLLFLGSVDYGRFLYYDLGISSAARVAATTASNHCVSRQNCGDYSTGSGDAWVIQSAYCESTRLGLQPSVTSCDPCMTVTC